MAMHGPYYSNIPCGTGSGTGSVTYQPGQFITSGGTWSTGQFNINVETSFGTPRATKVVMLPSGNLEVTAGSTVVEIPPELFKDLFAFAQMGLLEKLVPEEIDAK